MNWLNPVKLLTPIGIALICNIIISFSGAVELSQSKRSEIVTSADLSDTVKEILTQVDIKEE